MSTIIDINTEISSKKVILAVKKALPKLEWKLDKSLLTVKFFSMGKALEEAVVGTLLENTSLGITTARLREIILADARSQQEAEAQKADETIEYFYTKLPMKEADVCSDTDLNELDLFLWEGLYFSKKESSIFYVKDAPDKATLTAYQKPGSASDGAEVKLLKEAFCRLGSGGPERRLRLWLKTHPIDLRFFKELAATDIPATAWDFLRIKAHKTKEGGTVWDSLVIPAGNPRELYEGLLAYETEFRALGSRYIKDPPTLTNDPTEPALAYIDLEKLEEEYGDRGGSPLWDEFLLRRLHNEAYVSIFKAWVYSVAVGKNRGRQELWLYGNGGSGKTTLANAFTTGFTALAGKDICVAAHKGTGSGDFNDEILNKHLLIYSDAKNLKGGMSEFKHNITGGDFMSINAKYKKRVSQRVYLKCLTCSNELPKVDLTDRSQVSRYIILPFSLSDAEMAQYGLSTKSGGMKGDAYFEAQMEAEFLPFLASCKRHYEARCERDANIDAHEADDELKGIQLEEVAVVEEFIEAFFEVTDDPSERLTQKAFRAQCMAGAAWMDDESGAKVYASIKPDAVRSYLEKKWDFRWKAAWVEGKTQKAVVSTLKGLKVKPIARGLEAAASLDLSGL